MRGKTQRARERESERGMQVRIESAGSVRTREGGHGGKRWMKKKKEKKMESPRGGRGDWHSRLVKLWWLRMESAGYLTGGVKRGRVKRAAIGHGRSI